MYIDCKITGCAMGVLSILRINEIKGIEWN